jgi:predicted RNase H-like nuclease
VEAATRPGQLDRDEDPVDAVICAYVALYRYHRPEDVTTYGDFENGYIVTPTMPPDLAAPRLRPPQPDTDDARRRLAQLASLLEKAQVELAEIRRQLEP